MYLYTDRLRTAVHRLCKQCCNWYSYILLALAIFITFNLSLVLSSIITMLMPFCASFSKTATASNMIAGILSIILAFGFSFAMNSGTIAGSQCHFDADTGE